MRGFRYISVVFLLSLLLPSIAPQAHAQQKAQQQVTSGQFAVALNGPWKFRTGDSPKVGTSHAPLWAQPGFDDSGWQDYTIDPKHSKLSAVQALQAKGLPGWQQHGHPGTTGYAWYRIRLQIPPGTKSLALLMPQYFQDSFQIYADGQKIGGFGRLDGDRVVYTTLPKVFPIPDRLLRGDQPITLAVRFWSARYEAGAREHNLDGGLRGVPLVGPQTLLEFFRDAQVEKSKPSGILWFWLALNGAVGLISLFLFLFSRSQHEYLWAAISLLSVECIGAIFAVLPFIDPQSTILLVVAFVLWIGLSASPLVLVHLLGVSKDLWRRCTLAASILLAAAFFVIFSIFCGLLPPTLSWIRIQSILTILGGIGFALLLLAIAIDGLRTHGRKAWLPLIPGLFFAGYFACVFGRGIFLGRPEVWDIVESGCIFCIPLALLLVFLVRFAQQQRENAHMASELEAARSMQSLLVPAVSPNTPGFSVESVYLSASSVGGDFFQVQPGQDGSLVVVVGDVSGKGLKAAMTVSTIVGALRGCSLRGPADVLAYLNRVLHGQIKGFVTCCATLIAADGAMTIANAGHLSPYRNGEELTVEGGLPLGIVPDGDYEETHYELAPGDRLTFISDGVVEARNPKGELYGFERTLEISNLSAAAIAETARQFGQEDDITVLSVQYIGAEAVSPHRELESSISAD